MYVISEKAFQYSMIVCFKVPTKRELVQLLKREELWYNDGKHATTIMLQDPGIAVIVFYRWNNDASDYGVLSHEIFHVIDMNLRSKGITLSDDSDEVYAYHMGYFTREIYHLLWKK